MSAFDELTRRIATTKSRREALRVLAGGIAGLFISTAAQDKAIAQQISCKDRCRSKCTSRTNGRVQLDFACLRTCVADCGSSGCGTKVLEPCGVDRVTVTSLDAARLAILGGANDVPLSPQGCVRYQRVHNTQGQITSETISYGAKPGLTWSHLPTRTEINMDADLDGCPEWRAVITRGATINDRKVEIVELNSPTGNIRSRKTFTQTNDVVHVQQEESDASGQLRLVAKYDTGLSVSAGTSPGAAPAAGPCSSSDCIESILQDKLRRALDDGLQCLHKNKVFDLEMQVTAAYFRLPIKVRCANLDAAKDASTITPFPFPLDLFPNVNIDVNQNRFCGLSEQEQRGILFHELMHLVIPDHDPDQERDIGKRESVDRLYGCQSMCFNPPNNVTQCACASCLGTTKCDGRCDKALGFLDCSDDFGAWCPCPARLKWYPSCTDCLVGCPSGLACFAFSFCVPVNKGKCVPSTCP
jgi:hypothetical protein